MAQRRLPRRSGRRRLRAYSRGVDSRGLNWRELLGALQGSDRRSRGYAQDLLGVALLGLFTPLTVVALAGWSSGVVLDAWARLLRTWLGWGALVVPLAGAGAGVLLLASGLGRTVRLSGWRVLAIEAAAFSGLALLAVAAGESLPRAEAGQGGGLIGWGIAYVLGRALGPTVRTLALSIAFLGLLAVAIGWRDTYARSIQVAEWLDRYVIAALRAGLRRGRPLPRALRVDDSPASSQAAVHGTASAPVAPAVAQRSDGRTASRTAGVRFRPQASRDQASSKPRKRDQRLPPLDLLEAEDAFHIDEREINERAAIIERTLAEFGVPARVIDFKTGPAVTQFAVEPGFVEKPAPDGSIRKHKVRVSQISALGQDLSLALSAAPVRIEAPVPGHSYVGVEVPNRRTSVVHLRPVVESDAFRHIASPLAIALGRDVSGAPVASDLSNMPHLLIAGTTGSGKSVCIAALTTCLVMNNTPDELRLVMIDPKMVELVRFNGLPHLFGSVEVELQRILGVLRWCTREMDRRYKLFERVGARNLEAYRQRTAKRKEAESLPRIVIIVDELADLMMMAPDETERTLIRLAQMARATGMHLVVATQRPSTDIVTGLIKANFPARMSFAVASSIDSRVILDTAGAEALLGRGDLLFLAPESGAPMRLQGCFVSDREIDRLVEHWRQPAEPHQAKAAAEPVISPIRVAPPPWEEMLAREAVVADKDDQIEQAIAVVKKYGTASASLLQRKLKLGYPRAARLMDELHAMGVIGRPQAGGKRREVLIEEDDDPIGERAAGDVPEDEEDDAA